jgi:beta-ureidopropionase / N-carbamoyl-L-amino-acid hydrolase
VGWVVNGWLDARAADDATLERLVGRVTAAGERSAAEHGVGLAVTRESYSPVALFDGALRDRLSAVLGGDRNCPPGPGMTRASCPHTCLLPCCSCAIRPG